jgi:hypothetical protein
MGWGDLLLWGALFAAGVAWGWLAWLVHRDGRAYREAERKEAAEEVVLELERRMAEWRARNLHERPGGGGGTDGPA